MDEKLSDFLKSTSNFIKQVDAGEKNYNSIPELHKIKNNESFEKVLEMNISSKRAEEKRKQEEELEKERKEKRKQEEELEKQKKIQAQADKRNERYWNSKKNNVVELNTNSYYDDIKERLNTINKEKNITKEVEEIKKDEVPAPQKQKGKDREYGE